MIDIQEALSERIKRYKNENWQEVFLIEKKDYEKQFAKAVDAFKKRINKDMVNANRKEFGYMAIRGKIEHIPDIEILRWFYRTCQKYSYTKDKKTGKRNTFSRCFFGALKVK